MSGDMSIPSRLTIVNSDNLRITKRKDSYTFITLMDEKHGEGGHFARPEPKRS